MGFGSLEFLNWKCGSFVVLGLQCTINAHLISHFWEEVARFYGLENNTARFPDSFGKKSGHFDFPQKTRHFFLQKTGMFTTLKKSGHSLK